MKNLPVLALVTFGETPKDIDAVLPHLPDLDADGHEHHPLHLDDDTGPHYWETATKLVGLAARNPKVIVVASDHTIEPEDHRKMVERMRVRYEAEVHDVHITANN